MSLSIDPDIVATVNSMDPKTVGQRVALENSLQIKRNEAAYHKMISEATGTGGSIDMSLTPEEVEKLKKELMGPHFKPTVLPTHSEPTFTGSTVGQQMIQVPSNILRALVRSVGGSITLDKYDLARDSDEELEFIMFADPEQVMIRIKEADDAGDPGDGGGYHGFSGVH